MCYLDLLFLSSLYDPTSSIINAWTLKQSCEAIYIHIYSINVKSASPPI